MDISWKQVEEFASLYAGKQIFGIPKSGQILAYAMASFEPTVRVVQSVEKADFIVDDIRDSGATEERFLQEFPSVKPGQMQYLVDRRDLDEDAGWVNFPWEGDSFKPDAEDVPRRLLQLIGENPDREGLRDTPKRFLKAWKEWTKGYSQDPKEVMKAFEDGAEGVDEMVVVKDIPFYSHCEHHLAGIFGTVTIAYIPNGKVLGLSKLSRLTDIFARRLQVQERMTQQIANALNDNLQPHGVAVLVKARHMCMESRGINKVGSQTVTSALKGAFMDGNARAEFLSLAN